jgi:hypothetical protein
LKGPFRHFISECKKVFEFLVKDYGFRLPSEKEYGRERVIEFLKKDVTVSISFDWDTVFVLIKRPHSEMGEKSGDNSFSLDELIHLFSPKSTLIDLQQKGKWNEKKISGILSAYAELLKKYGADVLMGKFEILATILLAREKRLQKS